MMKPTAATLLLAVITRTTSADYNPGVPENALELAKLAYPLKSHDEGLGNVLASSFEGQHNCGITGHKPLKPRSLSFCHKFNDLACCAPVMDDENTEMFDLLTGLGLSCRLRGDIRDDPIAKWYCLNCDPEQPKYVRSAAYPGNEDGTPSDDRGASLLVCRDWAEDSFGINPILAGPNDRFDQCGLKKSSPCLDVSEKAIPDRDRYTCGDDLVVPSSYKVVDSAGNVDTVASIEAFMNADSMGPPVLDEMYGFKLVKNEVCTEKELIDLYNLVKPDTFDDAAKAAQQPTCLRTHDQLVNTVYDFGGAKPTTKVASTFRDYFCNNRFNGGDASKIPGDGDPGHFTPENCTDVRENAESTKVNSAGDKCKVGDPAGTPGAKTAAEYRAKYPCCCGSWEAEKCFNGAGQLVPAWLSVALAAAVAVLAAW